MIKWIKARMKAKEHIKMNRNKIPPNETQINTIQSDTAHQKRKASDKLDKTVQFMESTRALSNPGCGWYHLYSFNLAEDSFLYIACEEEELVLLRIDIHAFRSCGQIPKAALDRADRILSFFAQHGKGIILRIVYDTDGRGMEHEPSSITLVKAHMMQLGAVIKAHEGEILVHQGLFVGSWGEMHSSKFLMGGRMEELASTLVQAIGGTCPIAVRKPAQLRTLSSQKTDSQFEQNVCQIATQAVQTQQLAFHPTFTLFNDGIFGSETDLGTYDTMSRQDELSWQQRQMQRSFCGGEALGGMDATRFFGETALSFTILSWQQAAADLAQMHVSYLNSVYRQELLDDWKAQRAVWNNKEMNGYDYIGHHLGYRFTVVCVRIIRENTSSNQNETPVTLQITVRNTGFANLCEEAICKLIVIRKDAVVQTIEIASDARTWDSGTDTIISCNRSQEIQPMQECEDLSSKAFLQLTRKRDGRIIEFANEEYDRHFGGVLLKSF